MDENEKESGKRATDLRDRELQTGDAYVWGV